MRRKPLWFVFLAVASMTIAACPSGNNSRSTDSTNDEQRGTTSAPLRVMLVPADGGTEDGTLADFQPIFNQISDMEGLEFDIRVGQSYSAVVNAMVNRQVDIAFLGAVTYHQARTAGAAELLAVAELNGESIYFAGIFVRKDSGIDSLSGLKGKSIAFGDINSTSSFNFPTAMLLESGIDPAHDLKDIYLTGTHATSLQALAAGKADAACAAFNSFEKAVQAGKLDPEKIKALAKSQPIPYPPLAMHVELSPSLKRRLRNAFNKVHEHKGISPNHIRGYGGKRVDRYNADYPAEEFDRAMAKLAGVTKELKEAVLKKAGNRTK